MIIIMLIAVAAILLLQVSGAVPLSSVGGPMTLALAFLVAALAAGIHEAWVNKRGLLGWLVSIFAALTGAFLAASVGSMAIDMILMHANIGGSLAETRHPLRYVLLAGMMVLTLTGSWLALWIVNRVR